MPGGRVKLWWVLVIMKQPDSTYRAFGPGYSKDKDGGHEREGREGHFQLAKGGARRETDLAVVVLASACGVLSAKPSGSPIDPRHPEISGGLRRLQRRVNRRLGAFGAVSGG